MSGCPNKDLKYGDWSASMWARNGEGADRCEGAFVTHFRGKNGTKSRF